MNKIKNKIHRQKWVSTNFIWYILFVDFYYCYDLICDKTSEINKIVK